MSEAKNATGFMCESRALSDVMLRISLAVSGKSLEEINLLLPKFWKDEASAQEVADIVAASEARMGSKRHAAIFATLLRLVAKEYLRSLGFAGQDLEQNMKFLMDTIIRDPVTFEFGDPLEGRFPEGPTRGKS